MRNAYLNRQQYDLLPVLYMPTNVFACVDKDWQQRSGEKTRQEGLEVCRMLSSLVKQFAELHPDWQFYSRYHTYMHDALDDFYIYKGKELLGSVSTSGGGRKYYITSPLIKEKLERGSGRETKSYDKALYWLKTLQPKTLDTKMQESKGAIEAAIRRAKNDCTSELDYKVRNMLTYLKEYVYENFSTLSSIAVKAGMHESVVSAISDARVRLDVVENVMGDDYNKGVSVLIQDNVYVITNPKEHINKYTTYSSSDTIPDNIRRGIGILKLAADESFVRDVGYRHDSTRFFVLTESTDDQTS